AVAYAQALVRRLDGELVPAARVALLVVVQAREAEVEHRVRLRLRSARHRRAATGGRGEADRPVVWVRPGGVVTGRELILGDPRARGREGARLRGTRPAEWDLPRYGHGARSGPHSEHGDNHSSKAEPTNVARSHIPLLAP